MRSQAIGLLLVLGLLAGLPAAAEEPKKVKTGAVEGKISHWSVKKYPTVVYFEKMGKLEFEAPKKPAKMDQVGKEFTPKVLVVLVGSTVTFHNSDGFAHNVFSPDGEKYNLGKFGKDKSRDHTFKKLGVYTQLCDIHPEMLAYVVVVETPFHAVVDKKGMFRIDNLPPGNWTLRVWNAKLERRYVKLTASVEIELGKTSKVGIKPKKKKR